MTVYRKRRSQRRQRQRQRQTRRNYWPQRGGDGETSPSAETFAQKMAKFGAKTGPVGSRPVSNPVVQKGSEASVNLAGDLTHLNMPGQYGPENSTSNVLPSVNVGAALPIRAVQPGSIAEEKAQQAAEKRGANAKAKAEKNARNAAAAKQSTFANNVMSGLSAFAATPKGQWPSGPWKPGPQYSNAAPVAPKSYYNLSPAERKAAAAEYKTQFAAEQGTYVPAPATPPTRRLYANPNPFETGATTHAEFVASNADWALMGKPLYPTNNTRTVHSRGGITFNGRGGARRMTRRSKNRKTSKS